MSTEQHDHPGDDHLGDGRLGGGHPGDTGRSDTGPGDAGGAGGTDDARDAGRGGGRRRPRATVVAVAVAVLLAGGGAYWAASSGGDHGDDKASASQPLRFDGPDPVAGGPGTGTNTMPVAGGDTYKLTGSLPGGPKSAAVYRAAQGPDEAAVHRLAERLGLTGPVNTVDGSWLVGGSKDGGSPTLMVGKDAPGAWSYTRFGPPAVARPDAATSSSSSSSVSSSSDDGSGTSAQGGDSGPVSAQRARSAAQPLLDGLGLSGAHVDATQTVGALRTVTADPEFGGLPTHGWSTTVQVGADATVTSAFGRLSAPVKGSSYPVVSAATALKELNARAVAYPQICAMPLPQPRLPAPGAQSDGANSASGAKGSSGANGSSTAKGTTGSGSTPGGSKPCVPAGPHEVQVRGATFGLALQFVSGVQSLVPAWLFDTAQAGVARTAVVAQTAVDPAYVTGGGNGSASPTPVPPGSVSPGPANPGGPRRPVPPPSAGPAAHAVDVTAYHAAGSTLTVTFEGGLCPSYAASADESAGQVRVRVTETPAKAGKMCPMIIKSLTRTVTLEQPLGARTVVDASDGQPVRGQ